MQTLQLTGRPGTGWDFADVPAGFAAQLVLWFAPRQADGAALQATLQVRFPAAEVIGVSSSGEIAGSEVRDDSLVATAIRFEHAKVRVVKAEGAEPAQSKAIGSALARQLQAPDLRGVMIFSDGLKVSGTALGQGFTDVLGLELPVCGALAGDGARFEQTWVACNGAPAQGRVAAIGFYGDSLAMRFGTGGGWDRFGPERRITRAADNRLYELDGQPALALYKKYLGDEADALPGSALHFPLFVRPLGGGGGVTRTVLGVSETEESITFAGDLPVGHSAQLMHGNFDRMISGAADSTRHMADAGDGRDGLVLLMSCVGRKLVLGARVGEEVEAALEHLPRGIPSLGFYSYGGLAPTPGLDGTHLHNQTLTAVLLREASA